MAGVGTDKAFNYDLDVLTLVNNEGEGFDIRKIFVGLKLHESITQNFLSGEVSILDATGMIENAKLFGQETLRLKFSHPGVKDTEDVDENTIDQIFRIYHVGEVKRVGQNSLLYNLRFCAPELIHAKRVRISQAYKGSMIEIATQIAKDELGIEASIPTATSSVKLKPFFETSVWDKAQDNKVIIPNWSINYTINWLCKQAQGRDDAEGLQDSFFFYQTAVGGYRIESLAAMIQKSAGGTTLYYSVPNIDSMVDPKSIPWDCEPDDIDGIIGMGRRIQAYEIGSIANILEGTVEGLFGSKQTTIFTTNQYMHETSYNYHNKFFANNESALTADNPLVRQSAEEIYCGEPAFGDEDVRVNPYENQVIYGEPISNYKDAKQVLTSQTHFMHDKEGNIKSSADGTHMGTALFRQAAEQLLDYYTLNLVLPCRTDISTGTIIDIDIPPARPGEQENPINHFHQGAHLLTDIMWELTYTECKVSVKCIKDSLMNEIETTRIDIPPTISEVEGKV